MKTKSLQYYLLTGLGLIAFAAPAFAALAGITAQIEPKSIGVEPSLFARGSAVK